MPRLFFLASPAVPALKSEISGRRSRPQAAGAQLYFDGENLVLRAGILYFLIFIVFC